MRILFLRHGQTDWNAKHRIQGGIAEIDLNEDGVRQAEAAADGMSRAGKSWGDTSFGVSIFTANPTLFGR